MGAVILMANVLDVMAGPGMLPARGCPDHNLAVISAYTAGLFALLHTFWGVIAFSDWKLAFVLASHLFASLLTLNNEDEGHCAGTLVPLSLQMVATGVLTWRIARMRFVKPEARVV